MTENNDASWKCQLPAGRRSCCLLNKRPPCRPRQKARQMCIVFLAECTIFRKPDCFAEVREHVSTSVVGHVCRALFIKPNYISHQSPSGASFKMAPSAAQLLPFFPGPAFGPVLAIPFSLTGKFETWHTRRIRNVPALLESLLRDACRHATRTASGATG